MNYDMPELLPFGVAYYSKDGTIDCTAVIEAVDYADACAKAQSECNGTTFEVFEPGSVLAATDPTHLFYHSRLEWLDRKGNPPEAT